MSVLISLDNITICGNPSKYVLKNLEINPLIEKYWITENNLYHYNFKLIGGGFIQLKHEQDWFKSRKTKCRTCDGSGINPFYHCKHKKAYCRECHGDNKPTEPCEKCEGLGGKIVVSENGIRIEFNPNKYQSKTQQLAIMDLLKNVWNPHCTRRDIAIDFFDEELNECHILDGISRERRLYLDGNSKFETMYIGSAKSDLQIRIYNKAIEQDLKDITWWRVEAQMRKVYADTFFFNPFNQLRIKRKMDFSKYDFKTECILKCLVDDPSGYEKLSKPSRLKYKKMLMEDVESVELKLTDLFDENARELYQLLESWFSFSEHSNREHRTAMSKPDTILKSEIKHIREIMTLEDALKREKLGI